MKRNSAGDGRGASVHEGGNRRRDDHKGDGREDGGRAGSPEDAGGRRNGPSALRALERPVVAVLVLASVPLVVATVATFAPVWSPARAAELGWRLPLRGPWFTLWAWAGAAAIGAVYAGLWHRDLRRAGGMALMWVPVVRAVQGIINDYSALVTGGQVLQAFTHYQLSSFYIYSILRHLGYLGAGFLLWSGWRPADGMRGLAVRLHAAAGRVVAVPEGRSATLGFLLFPVLLFSTYAVNMLLQQAEPLVNSDESSIWRNVTPWHAIMISAAAALGEEAVYRVFLMTALAVLLQRIGLPARPAWTAALVAQATLFGFAHAGYANWLHVIMAGLFGLVAGGTALWLGVWAAIMLHFLVDIYAIGGHASAPVWFGFLLALLVTNILATLVTGARWLLRRLRPTA